MTDQIKPIFPTSLMVRHIADMQATNAALAGLIGEIETGDKNSATGSQPRAGSRPPTPCSAPTPKPTIPR